MGLETVYGSTRTCYYDSLFGPKFIKESDPVTRLETPGGGIHSPVNITDRYDATKYSFDV